MTSATVNESRGNSGQKQFKVAWPQRGWRTYLVLATLLAPVCVPMGPGQTAILDFLNLPALGVFLLLLLAGRRIRTPLLFSVCVVSLGSLFATLSAPSMRMAILAVAQDAYLFLWFLLLVNVLRGERDLRAVRVAWMWAAVAVSLWALVQLFLTSGTLAGLLGSRGFRPPGTLYNPNMLADYLVMSLFIGVSLVNDLPKLLVGLACGAIVLGLLATKSNGGMISLGAGVAVWCVVKALASRLPLRPVFAVLSLVVGLSGFAWWLHTEWKVGEAQLAALQRHTFAGRMEHSGESRGRIRDTLERTYARSPLGIGPGNSGALTLSIAERERPDSYQAKEAHSDYLAYAIERGPLGLAGLLIMSLMGFAHAAGYWKFSPTSGIRGERAALWTASMAAALMSSAVHSTVIEKLHFRHFWLFLAVVCASTFVAKRHAARREARGLERRPAPVVTSVGLPPRAPGRAIPALAAALAAPVRARFARNLPALARRYRSTGTDDPSGGVRS